MQQQQQQQNARRRAAMFLGVVAGCAVVAACGSSGDASTGPKAPLNIGGGWSLSVAVSNAAVGMSCQGSGLVSLVQIGSNFTGYVTNSGLVCTGANGATAGGSMDGPLTGGQIDGTTVTVSDGSGCSYTGTASGSPVNRIDGHVTCMVPLNGTVYPFTGPFVATR
ncbi:MAG TPA: hypothetical protein VH439_17215 [Gemmatimonadales bacterium]|jgi:hypothetical protein